MSINNKEKSLFLIITILLFLVVLIRNSWIGDDAYITFRTVDNFVNGYGLTWNVAERVQAFTNPLWTLFLSGFYFFTGEIYYTSIFVSIALSLALMILLSFKMSINFVNSLLIITIAIFSKSYIDYTVSGLENVLTNFLLVIFGYVFLTRKISEKTLFILSAIAALGVLNRMDTVLIYIPAIAYLLFRIRSLRGLLISVFGFLPFILWEVFSLIYYGFPFPNTFYAKMHTGLPINDIMQQGFIYFLETINQDPLTMIIIAAGLSAAFLSKNRRSLFIAVGVILYLIYIVRIGGDFMMGRFFSAPFVVALLLISQIKLPKTWQGQLLPFVPIIILGLAAPNSPVFCNNPYEIHTMEQNGIVDEKAYYYNNSTLLKINHDYLLPDHKWSIYGIELKERKDRVFVLGNIGFSGFFAGPDSYIIDIFGLSDPLLSRLPTCNKYEWRIGHFLRNIPSGYLKTIRTGTNHISDTCLAKYYDKIKIIVCDEIFSWERLKTIWFMNTGKYDHLIDSYVNQPSIIVNYQDICQPKAAGTTWNNDKCFEIRYNGIEINFDKIDYRDDIEVSVDHNDQYVISFMKDSVEFGYSFIERNHIESGGLRVDTLEVPKLVGITGFNKICIYPQRGDDLFSVGHLRTLEIAKK